MTPQTLATIRIVLTFALGILASRGLISRETADYLAGPETMAIIGIAGALATGAWALWSNRPHAIIKAAAALPQVDVVIAKPKTAGEVQIGNVVGSVTEASRVPGVVA